jgi:hypothetical protein
MKNNTIMKVTTVAALAAAATFGLSACSSTPAEETGSSSMVVAPTIVDVATLDGQSVDISTGGFIDINTGDTDPADWSAEVENPDVINFTAGGEDGGAVMNPGIEGKAAGSTKVTLTNKTSGDVVTFTVNVS